MAEIVVFDIPISESAVGSRAARRNVVINPKRDVLPEAASADDRKRVWSKKVSPWSESVLSDDSRGLLPIQGEIPFVPKGNRQVSRNLAGIDRTRKGLLLRLCTQQDRWLLHEALVVLRKLESVLLEGLPEVIQFRVVAVAGSA